MSSGVSSDRGSDGADARELEMPGRSLFLTGKGIAVVRGITTGGSSIYYYGTAFDPPLEMLRGHGLDIAAEVEEAKRELGIPTRVARSRSGICSTPTSRRSTRTSTFAMRR